MTSEEDMRAKLLQSAFRMPKAQTPASRKSSITNAFVNAVIPVLVPTADEIDEALRILGMDPADVRCSYCGDPATEWDHLRPLVLDRKPTGYISEIANLVPACGKCNQSKGNKSWRRWMVSQARLSPTGRGLDDVSERMERLERYESWRTAVCIDFADFVGHDRWADYWSRLGYVIDEMQNCQLVANEIRQAVAEKLKAQR